MNELETTATAPTVGEAVEVRSARWEGPRTGTIKAVSGTPGNFHVSVEVKTWGGTALLEIYGVEVYGPLTEDQRGTASERARNALLGAWCERANAK